MFGMSVAGEAGSGASLEQCLTSASAWFGPRTFFLNSLVFNDKNRDWRGLGILENGLGKVTGLCHCSWGLDTIAPCSAGGPRWAGRQLGVDSLVLWLIVYRTLGQFFHLLAGFQFFLSINLRGWGSVTAKNLSCFYSPSPQAFLFWCPWGSLTASSCPLICMLSLYCRVAFLNI